MDSQFCLRITYRITLFATGDYSSLLAVERKVGKAVSFKTQEHVYIPSAGFT